MKKVFCCLLCMCMIMIGAIPAFAEGTEVSVLRQVYEPETKMILPPTVIEKLQTRQQLTALQASETPPQVLQISLNQNNMVSLGNTQVELSEVLDLCQGTILPMIELNERNIEWLVAVLKERSETDLFVMSHQESVLKTVMEYHLPYVYGVYRASAVEDAATIAKKAHTAKANTVLFCSIDQVTAEQVRDLQSRFLTVFLDGSLVNDTFSVRQAVDAGADGVVVTHAHEAYEMYTVAEKAAYTRRPFVVGHRGFPTTAPENTVEGMIAAFDAGADAVECDVYLTADNHVVVNHNGNLSGYTTDDTATASVESLTREQLKQYTLKAVGDYTDCKIAFLDEMYGVLKTYPEKTLVVEIKTGKTAVVQRIYDLAKEYGVLDQIVVISFLAEQLKVCRQIMPEVGASYLFSPAGENEEVAANMLGAVSSLSAFISPQGGSTTTPVRQMLYYRGVACNVWTINGTMALKNQVRYGAMHLTTNDVGLAVSVRDTLTVSTADDFWGEASFKLPVFGDVDGDGAVAAADALMVLKSVVGKVTLTEKQQVLADVDGDSNIAAKDALLILQKVVGKIDKFPVEETV